MRTQSSLPTYTRTDAQTHTHTQETRHASCAAIELCAQIRMCSSWAGSILWITAPAKFQNSTSTRVRSHTISFSVHSDADEFVRAQVYRGGERSRRST